MSRRVSIVSVLLSASVLGLAGCSDNPAPATDAGTTADVGAVADAGTTADVPGATDAGLPADAGPSTDAGTPGDADTPVDAGTSPACTLTRALVTTSNFMAGGYALGTITPPALSVPMAMAPDQDHLPVQSGCQVFTLLRGNDSLAVLDAQNLPAVRRTISLRTAMGDAGTGSYQVNPYDVELVSPTRAYVAQFAASRIAIVDPTRDGAAAVTGSIDLAPVRAAADTDPSGAPEASELLRVGDRVFVVLQNLASFAPVAAGSLAIIDTRTDTLVDADPMTAGTQPLALQGRNPVAAVSTAGGRIVVAAAGTQPFMPPNVLDGAIEAIDAATLRPVGMRVTEMALGGDLQNLVMLTENRGWAVVYRFVAGGAREALVVPFDLSTGTVSAPVLTAADLGGIARAPDGTVWVLDRSPGAAGVRVFSAMGMAVTTMALSTGTLPPYGIAFVP